MAEQARLPAIALYLGLSLVAAYLVTAAVHGWFNAVVPCLVPWIIAAVYVVVTRRPLHAWLALALLLLFFSYPHLFGHRLPWAR